jgi:hypothetical protein
MVQADQMLQGHDIGFCGGCSFTFSNLAFMKTKLCNCLMIHLDLVVQMYDP